MIKQIWMYKLEFITFIHTENSETPSGYNYPSFFFLAEDNSDAIDQAQKQINRILRLKERYGEILEVFLEKTLCKRYNRRTGMRDIFFTKVAKWGENGTRNRGESG